MHTDDQNEDSGQWKRDRDDDVEQLWNDLWCTMRNRVLNRSLQIDEDLATLRHALCESVSKEDG